MWVVHPSRTHPSFSRPCHLIIALFSSIYLTRGRCDLRGLDGPIWVIVRRHTLAAGQGCSRFPRFATLPPAPGPNRTLPRLTPTYSTTFLFRENPLPILCPISHMLTRAIRDNAILVDGYASAEPFFATNLRGQGMMAMKVQWMPDWLKRLVFRRSARPV